MSADLAATLAAMAGVLLPWLAGGLLVRALAPAPTRGPDALALGYGWMLGAFAATLVMRALSLAGVRWSLPLLAVAMAVVAALAVVAIRRRRADRVEPPPRYAGESTLDLPAWLWGLALALVTIRLAGLAAEMLSSPMRGYDPWAHWATKARVWFDAGAILPFVSGDTWIARGDPGLYTDMNPGHPGTLPLLQAWIATFVGTWNDSLVGLPWIAFGVALPLAFYAQARAAGAAPALAMVATWMLASMPVLGSHVTVAGSADLPLAAAFGMAAMATWRWTRTRETPMAVLALGCAAAGAWMKVEGILWMATLVPAVVMSLHRRAGFALAGVAFAAFAAHVAYGPERMPVQGYTLFSRPVDVTGPAFDHLFVFGNWHLGAWFLVALAAWRWRTLLSPRLAPMTMTMVAGIALVAIVFFFTNAAGGVANETLVTRLPFHLVPAAAFYALLLVLDGTARDAVQPSRAATKAADA